MPPLSRPMQDPRVAIYIRDLFDRAERLRMPEVFVEPHPDALYHVPNRHGISVTALRTGSLSREQLTTILTYRLVQYLATDLVDPAMVCATRMEHDPLDGVSPDDIHVIAGSPETGRLFCYMVLRALDATPATATMRVRNRPLFPVEEAFGWGVFSRLNILPDLPVTRVLELSRFVKNHEFDARHAGSVRSPVEMGVALYHILCDAPNHTFAAVVGDLEERGAKRNLDFFHIPTVLLHGSEPATAEQGFLRWAARSRTFLPFAFLVTDFARQQERVAMIEAALELADAHCIRAVLALKRQLDVPKSSMEPVEQCPSPRSSRHDRVYQPAHLQR